MATTTPISGLTALATGPASTDLAVIVDVSDTTQAPTGTTKKITIANLFTSMGITTSATVTSPSSSAFAVGLAGATNPAFQVDSSTASQAAGLKVTGAIAAGTVAIGVISSGADANVSLNAKGTGDILVGNVSTGDLLVSVDAVFNASLEVGLGTTLEAVTVNDTITSNKAGAVMARPNTVTTTSAVYGQFINDGVNVAWGAESTAGAAIFGGTTGYAAVFGTSTADPVQICTNNAVAVTIASGGGVTLPAGNLAVSAGSITASGSITTGALTLHTTSATLTAGATGNSPTLATGPFGGEPDKWISIVDNGTTRWIPTWSN